MSFERFNLNSKIQEGIAAQGYTEPTPIQQKAIPHVLAGHDVMGLAQTGTGKTAAFVLPILEHMLNGPRRRFRALIISPTRELAEQISESIRELGEFTGLKSIVIYGGVNMNPQKAAIKAQKAEVIVACPGRLLDHLDQGMLNLSQIEVLVLDEADRMMDMGFMPDIRRILRFVVNRKQTLMFSATMPDDIRRLSGDILNDHVTVQISRDAPAKNVSHQLYSVPRHLKTALLKALVKSAGDGPILIFTKTRDRASKLGQELKSVGFRATSLQGNMIQSRRQAALDGFRDGTYNVLAATDVAARGIDIDDITHVINYDLPDNVEDYIHRVGRTGRASKKGDAYSIVTPEDAPTIRAYERVLDVELQDSELEGFDYNVAPPPKARKHGHGQRHQTHEQRKKSRQGSSRRGRGKS